MPDQKIDNLLNLAMDAIPEERAKSENLNVGYDSSERLWDVIVKYSGPESGLGGEGIQVVPLLGGYAVVTLPESEIKAYSAREQIEFIEKPKRLYFETFEGREASCILPVQAGSNGLTGKEILVGVVDSGVDFFHPDFRNEDGSSRILRLRWRYIAEAVSVAVSPALSVIALTALPFCWTLMLSGCVTTSISSSVLAPPARAVTVTVPDSGAVRTLPSIVPRSARSVTSCEDMGI